MWPLASWIGTLPGWLTVAAAVGAAAIFWRGGGGTALSTLQAANLVLERRVRELEVQGKMDAATIAELKGKTDVALAVQPFMKWAELHETRAAERHIGMMKAQEQTTTILTMIGERLGTDA